MSFYRTILYFLLVQTVLAVPSNVARHHAIAARMPVPQANVAELPVVKRAINRRCRQRNSTTTSKPAATTVPVVGNVGSDPDTTTSTTSTTHSPSTTSHSSSAPPPPPPPKTTTTKAPEPTHNSGGSSGGGSNLPSFMTGVQTGQGTYYDTGLTACGVTNSNSDLIAAVSHLLFDTFPGYNGANPNDNPVCGRKVKATYKGNEVVVSITDRCTGCAITDLDFTPTALAKLDPNYQTDGRIYGVEWTWV